MRTSRPLLALAVLALLGCPDDVGKDLLPGATVTVPLAQPTNLGGTLSGTSVNLSWTDNASGETGYRVDVNDVPGFSGTIYKVYLLTANSTAYTFTGSGGTTYYFRVLAVTATLESDPSATFSITTLNPPPTPGNFTATVISSTRIDLAWVDVPTETSYRIERSLDDGFTWPTSIPLAANATFYSDTGLTPDTTYTYRLYATNADGDSAPTADVAATTLSAAMTISSTATAGNVGQYTSIAVTSGGVPHVAHYDATNTNVLYTTSGATPLAATTVDTGPTGTQNVGGDGTAIALDGAGKVHIVAHDLTSQTLRYVTNESGAFVASTIDATGFVGVSPTIAISPLDGSIHVIYLDDLAGADNLKHASRTPPSATWSFEDILPTGTTLGSWGVAVDAAGGIHVSYNHTDDGITYELVYGKKTGSSWAFTPFTSVGRPGMNSLALTGSGVPHIAYFEQANTRLMHATNAGGPWTTELVHEVSGGNVGQHNSISINPTTGRIHVAYYDATNGDLRYARKDPAGSWVLRLIDLTGNVGQYTGIGIDGTGQAWISYYDATNGELKIASGAP